MALRISAPGASHLALHIKLVVRNLITFHDPGFGWDCWCGYGGVDNLCPWNLSFGFLYQRWLYLVTLSLMTPDSNGIFVVALVALI